MPYSLPYVRRRVAATFGSEPAVRGGAASPFVTDNGNAILDCAFGPISDPAARDAELRAIHGVVATGLFCGLTDAVIVADPEGVRELAR